MACRTPSVLDLEDPVREALDHANVVLALVDALVSRIPDSEITLTAEEARSVQFAAMLARMAARKAVEAYEAADPRKGP